jgi:hypothetical protein
MGAWKMDIRYKKLDFFLFASSSSLLSIIIGKGGSRLTEMLKMLPLFFDTIKYLHSF